MGTQKTLRWVVALAGLWEVIAALWDAIIVGLVLICLGAWAAATCSAPALRIQAAAQRAGRATANSTTSNINRKKNALRYPPTKRVASPA